MAIIEDIWNLLGKRDEGNVKRTVKATVLRTDEDGRTWVHIDGGVDETPVYSTTAKVNAGDEVSLRIEGGKAYIDGSTSSPSVGYATYAQKMQDVDEAIDEAQEDAQAAVRASEAAERAAEEAADVSNAIGQHFWNNEQDSETHGGTGIHVTDETKDDWVDAVAAGFDDLSAQKPYHNILINSLGILLRSALKNLVSITRSAISFYDGLGNGSNNVTATFGSNGAQIGKTSSDHATINTNGLSVYDGNGARTAKFGGTVTYIGRQDDYHLRLDGTYGSMSIYHGNNEVIKLYKFSNNDTGGIVALGPNSSLTGDGSIGSDEYISMSATAGHSGVPASQRDTVYSQIHAQTDGYFSSVKACANGEVYIHCYNDSSGSSDYMFDRIGLNMHVKKLENVSGIELNPYSSTANHGGYIDFHYNQDSADYTHRIIALSETGGIEFASKVAQVLRVRSYGIDATSSTNGVTAIRYPGVSISDKNDRILSRFECAIPTDGSKQAYWYVRQYDANGTNTAQRGIRIKIPWGGDGGDIHGG